MRRITDSTCILESRELGRDTFEVCAAEVANFDDIESVLTVKLDSFVRKVNPRGADVVLRPSWLPQSETIRHHISQDEATDDARETFERWSEKVKRSVPPTEEFQASVIIASTRTTGSNLHAERSNT